MLDTKSLSKQPTLRSNSIKPDRKQSLNSSIELYNSSEEGDEDEGSKSAN